MRNAGAIDVGVEQADLAAGSLEAEREGGGDGALADAPFAGADSDDALGGEPDLAKLVGPAVVRGEIDFHVGDAGQASANEVGEALASLLAQGRGVSRKGERERSGRAAQGQIVDLLVAGGAK